jgi:hypothetical protein
MRFDNVHKLEPLPRYGDDSIISETSPAPDPVPAPFPGEPLDDPGAQPGDPGADPMPAGIEPERQPTDPLVATVDRLCADIRRVLDRERRMSEAMGNGIESVLLASQHISAALSHFQEACSVMKADRPPAVS